MRLFIILLTTFLLGCSIARKTDGLFTNFADKERVVIYLSKYHLDSVPSDISQLKKVKSLYIAKDSTNGWTVYPPLSALQEMTKMPPFRQLPDQITDLSELQKLELKDLDLVKLPDNFSNLQKLDSLSLILNKLTITNEIGKLNKLKNLKYLALFGNKVDTTDIKELKKANPNLTIKSGLE